MTRDEFKKLVEESGGTWVDPSTESSRVTFLGPKGAKAMGGVVAGQSSPPAEKPKEGS